MVMILVVPYFVCVNLVSSQISVVLQFASFSSCCQHSGSFLNLVDMNFVSENVPLVLATIQILIRLMIMFVGPSTAMCCMVLVCGDRIMTGSASEDTAIAAIC